LKFALLYQGTSLKQHLLECSSCMYALWTFQTCSGIILASKKLPEAKKARCISTSACSFEFLPARTSFFYKPIHKNLLPFVFSINLSSFCLFRISFDFGPITKSVQTSNMCKGEIKFLPPSRTLNRVLNVVMCLSVLRIARKQSKALLSSTKANSVCNARVSTHVVLFIAQDVLLKQSFNMCSMEDRLVSLGSRLTESNGFKNKYIIWAMIILCLMKKKSVCRS
jgi:hypothetical protein